MPDSQRRSPAPFAPGVYQNDEPAREPSAFEREVCSELRSLRAALSRAGATPDLAAEVEALRAVVEELAVVTPRGRATALIRAVGIEGRLAGELARALAGSRAGDLDEALREAVRERVTTAPWPIMADSRRVIAVVGTAGVGKTTTVAKLAAQARLAGRSIAMISSDDFRVGGALQLERYAELLDAPFYVAHSQADVENIVRTEGAELIFLDTCGRPPTHAAPEMALRGIPRTRLERDVILCMSAGTRACDAERTASAFSPMRPTAIAITKLDETHAPSALIHGPVAAHLPLSVLCFGPRVPEDIIDATQDDFALRLVPSRPKERARSRKAPAAGDEVSE